MHPVDIQARLKKRGITQRMIARTLSVSDATVWKIIMGRGVSDRVMREISARIGKDHEKVFAWHYSKQRKRKSAKGRQEVMSKLTL